MLNENTKNKIKKIPFVKPLILIKKNIGICKEYINDYIYFKKNYLDSKQNENKIGYNMLFINHIIEKGLSHSNPRPFAKDRVPKLINLIKEYEKISDCNTYFYNSSLNCLNEYKKFYEEHNWCSEKEYGLVTDFLNQRNNYEKIIVGTTEIKYNEFKKYLDIDFYNFLKSRKSIRNFANKELLKEDIEKAVNMAILSPSACNRQMCKINYVKSSKLKKIVIKYAQGLTCFNLDNVNFFVITFDVNSLSYVGERNQGWFNAGLISMNFVNALHSLGIGSCFLQFGNSFKEEKELKNKLNIPSNERIAVIIAAGYYTDTSVVPVSSRKPTSDIYFER